MRPVRPPHLHPYPTPSAREEATQKTKAHLVLLVNVVIGFTEIHHALGRDVVHQRAAARVALEIDGKLVPPGPGHAGLRRCIGGAQGRRRDAACDDPHDGTRRDRETGEHDARPGYSGRHAEASGAWRTASIEPAHRLGGA